MNKKLKIISMINLRYYLVKLDGKEYLLDFTNPRKISKYGNYAQKDWQLYSTENIDYQAVKVPFIISKVKQLDWLFSLFFLIIIFTQKDNLFRSISPESFLKNLLLALLVNLLIFVICYLFINQRYKPFAIQNLKMAKQISLNNHASKKKMALFSILGWLMILAVALQGIISNNMIFMIFFAIIIPSVMWLYPIINIYPIFEKNSVYETKDGVPKSKSLPKKKRLSISLILGLLLLISWIIFILVQLPGDKYWGSLVFLAFGFLSTYLKRMGKEKRLSFVEGTATTLQIMAFLVYFICVLGLFIN